MAEDAETRPQQIRLFGAGTQDSAYFTVFNGNVQFNLLPGGDFSKRAFVTIYPQQVTMLRGITEKLKDQGPDANCTMVVTKANEQDKKKRDHYYTFNFIKDEARVYYLEVTIGNIKTRLHWGWLTDVAMGSEPLSKTSQSAALYETFLDWLKNRVPIDCALTSRRMAGNRGGGNYNRGGNRGGYNRGGGGGNRGGSGGYSRDRNRSSDQPTDDGGSRPEDFNDDMF